MNRALLNKSIRESRWLLAGSSAVVFAFNWLYVWMVSQLPMHQFKTIIKNVPEPFLKLSPIPIEQLTTVSGRVAMSYAEPIILIVITAWSVGRASDAVSGELGRGTLEMLLAQPVSRRSVLSANALVTVFGCAAIAASTWLGTAVGLAMMVLDDEPSAEIFLAPAANVFALGLFVAGATTAASAADRYRWRTIGIIGAAIVVEKIIEITSMMVTRLAWLERLTFFTLFKPPRFVTNPDLEANLFWQYNLALVGLGALGYIAAAVIFSPRSAGAAVTGAAAGGV